jgi:ABC-type transporter Mla maintaining outer membrane lipid asymmetry permease subunit MlaE
VVTDVGRDQRAVVNASLLVLMFNFVLSAFLFGK